MRTCNILLYAVFSTSLFFLLYFRDLSALSIFHFSAALAPPFPAIGVKSSGRPLIVFLFFLDYLSLPPLLLSTSSFSLVFFIVFFETPRLRSPKLIDGFS